MEATPEKPATTEGDNSDAKERGPNEKGDTSGDDESIIDLDDLPRVVFNQRGVPFVVMDDRPKPPKDRKKPSESSKPPPGHESHAEPSTPERSKNSENLSNIDDDSPQRPGHGDVPESFAETPTDRFMSEEIPLEDEYEEFVPIFASPFGPFVYSDQRPPPPRGFPHRGPHPDMRGRGGFPHPHFHRGHPGHPPFGVPFPGGHMVFVDEEEEEGGHEAQQRDMSQRTEESEGHPEDPASTVEDKAARVIIQSLQRELEAERKCAELNVQRLESQLHNTGEQLERALAELHAQGSTIIGLERALDMARHTPDNLSNLQAEKSLLQSQVFTFEKQLARLREELNDEQQRNESMQKELLQTKQSYSADVDTLKRETDKVTFDSEIEYNKLKSNVMVLHNELELTRQQKHDLVIAHNKEIESLNSQLHGKQQAFLEATQGQERCIELEAEVKSKNKLIMELESKLNSQNTEELQNKIAKVESAYNHQKLKAQQLEEQIERDRSGLTQLKAESLAKDKDLAQKKRELELSDIECQRLLSRHRELENEYQSTLRKYEISMTDVKVKEERALEAERKAERALQQCRKVEQEREELLRKASAAEKGLDTKRNKLEHVNGELQQQVLDLQKQLSETQDYVKRVCSMANEQRAHYEQLHADENNSHNRENAHLRDLVKQLQAELSDRDSKILQLEEVDHHHRNLIRMEQLYSEDVRQALANKDSEILKLTTRLQKAELSLSEFEDSKKNGNYSHSYSPQPAVDSSSFEPLFTYGSTSHVHAAPNLFSSSQGSSFDSKRAPVPNPSIQRNTSTHTSVLYERGRVASPSGRFTSTSPSAPLRRDVLTRENQAGGALNRDIPTASNLLGRYSHESLYNSSPRRAASPGSVRTPRSSLWPESNTRPPWPLYAH